MANVAAMNLALQDQSGNVLNNSTIEVRDELTSNLVPVFADFNATVSLGDPFVWANGAHVLFYVAPGLYKITATNGTFSRTWRHQLVGTGLPALDGTVGAPSIAFANETSTGFYRPAAGQVGLSVLGDQKILYDTSGTIQRYRETFTTSPVYDLAGNTLAAAIYMPLSASPQTVGNGKFFSGIRFSQSGGSYNDFTLGTTSAKAAAFEAYIRATATSDSSSAVYVIIGTAATQGPASAKGNYGRGTALGTATGPVMGTVGAIDVVATSNNRSSALELDMSSGPNDVGNMQLWQTTAHSRLRYGIFSFENLAYNLAAIALFIDTTASSSGARALSIQNATTPTGSASEVAWITKDGNFKAFTTLEAGSAAVQGQVTLWGVTSGFTSLIGPAAGGSGVFTLPDTGGSNFLVSRSSTDTLTNKTLTTPDINAGTADSLTSLSIRSTGAAFDLFFACNDATLTANRTLTYRVQNGNRAIQLAGDLTLGGSFTTSGASAVTLTSTGATNVTLPTSGTLYGTASASITSSQLATSMSDETGSGALVFADSPTFTTQIVCPLVIGGTATSSGLILQATNNAGSPTGTVTIKTGASGGNTVFTAGPAGGATFGNSVGVSVAGPFTLSSATRNLPAISITNTTNAGSAGISATLTQNAPNTTDTQDGAFSIAWTLSASSASNALVNRVFNFVATNSLTGGGAITNLRIFDLVANTSASTTTTNLEGIYLELGAAANGTVTTSYAVHIVSTQGTTKWGFYDESGAREYFSQSVNIGTTTGDPGAGGILINGQAYLPNHATTASAANAFLDTGSSPVGQLKRNTSAIRYKRDIRALTLDEAENIVLGARPVVYRSRCQGDDPNREFLGMIAEWESENDDRLVMHDGREFQNVQYDRYVAPLLAVIASLIKERRMEKPQ